MLSPQDTCYKQFKKVYRRFQLYRLNYAEFEQLDNTQRNRYLDILHKHKSSLYNLMNKITRTEIYHQGIYILPRLEEYLHEYEEYHRYIKLINRGKHQVSPYQHFITKLRKFIKPTPTMDELALLLKI